MNTVQDKSEHGSRKSARIAKQEDLRDRLSLAAEATIVQHGLAALRARTLAEAAGCSVGAIYQAYPDLDALILTVNGRTLDAIDAALSEVRPKKKPAEHMRRLADAYLTYAAGNRLRWAALFQHRMPAGRPVTPAFAEKLTAAFGHIEQPLATLRPDLSPPDRALLARTMFSAVHGMVALGLDEKVAVLTWPVLCEQVATIVTAMAKGLAKE